MANIQNRSDLLLQSITPRIAASVVTSTSTALSFTKTKNLTTIAPTSISLIVSLPEFTSPTVVWEYSIPSAPNTWNTISGASTTGTAPTKISTLVISSSTFVTQVGIGYSVYYRARATQSTWNELVSPTLEVKYVAVPDDIVVINFSREAVGLPTTLADVVTYTNSGASIGVTIGGTALNYNTSGANTFNVSASASGITLGSVSGTVTRVYADASAMTAGLTSTATITYTITVRDSFGTASTHTKIQTFNKLYGAAGGTGATGTRGTRTLYDTNAAGGSAGYNSLTLYVYGAYAAGSASYSAKATDLIAAATTGDTPTTPIKGDLVTFTNGSTFTNSITYNGSAWVAPGTIIDGNLLVTGSVTATQLSATAIDGKTITGAILKYGKTSAGDYTTPGYWLDSAGSVNLGGVTANLSVNPTTASTRIFWFNGGTSSVTSSILATQDKVDTGYDNYSAILADGTGSGVTSGGMRIGITGISNFATTGSLSVGIVGSGFNAGIYGVISTTSALGGLAGVYGHSTSTAPGVLARNQTAGNVALEISGTGKFRWNSIDIPAPTSGATTTYLRGDGTWGTPGGGGTVTSISGSGGSTGLTLTGGAITTSGTLTLGGTLGIGYGGTGATTASGARSALDVYSTGDVVSGINSAISGNNASYVSAYFQTISGMSSYQTTAGMSSYQTTAGMSSYLTTASAASTYLGITAQASDSNKLGGYTFTDISTAIATNYVAKGATYTIVLSGLGTYSGTIS